MSDSVNHPSHYNVGSIEVWVAIWVIITIMIIADGGDDMSRPRYWWDGVVKKELRMWYGGKIDLMTIRGAEINVAFTVALRKTREMQDGDDRARVVAMCYNEGRSIAGAAMEVNVSERTAQRWIACFIRMAGREMGYI